VLPPKPPPALPPPSPPPPPPPHEVNARTKNKHAKDLMMVCKSIMKTPLKGRMALAFIKYI
jgi:hypothetical protein